MAGFDVDGDKSLLNMRGWSAGRSSQGFTLMELLIVVAIIAISAQVAVPALMNLVRDNRLVSQLNGFTSSLLLARNQAASRNLHVALCPSTDGVSCTGGREWEMGWIVFVDSDDDRRVDEGETVLRRQQALRGGNTVESNVSRTSIGYSPMGRASSASFWICDPRGRPRRGGLLWEIMAARIRSTTRTVTAYVTTDPVIAM